MNNPYIYRGPVRSASMFFGRRREIAEIATFLRGNQSVSIVGPRKIGKTSLLFHLMRPEVWPTIGMDDNNLLVYLDCEVLGDLGHDDIFGQFSSEIAVALDERGLAAEPLLEAAMNQPGRMAFERALRKLNQRGLRVVLILDEFERLSTNPSLDLNFFNALRSAAGRYQLAFVTASARPLIQLTFSGRSREILSSPFFNIFAPLFLSLMPADEAHQAIQQPAQAAGAGFSPALEDAIYHLVSGFPLALQVTCFHAFELVTAEPPQTDFAEIERRALEELTPHFEYYWHNLSQSEQEAMQRIPEAAALASTDTRLRGILRDLVQKCLIVLEDGNYRYASRALANFIYSQAGPSPSARSASLLSGVHLGPYEVQEPLGQGGMAEVYKGRHSRLERTVAIKVLPAKLATEADFRQRFEREARAVASLKHTHIVQVFDFGDLDGMYYMVMEYIHGKDLGRFIKDNGPLKPSVVKPILLDLTNALDYAHGQGLVHRDIKPSNVLLEIGRDASRDAPYNEQPAQANQAGTPAISRAVLTDFGIAKIFTGEPSGTRTGMMIGTLDYMAPEQIRSAGEVDHRADIYALGVMLYQMLTGQLPFKGENPGAVMLAHLQESPLDPRLLNPEIPSQMAEAILCCLAKDPDARFSSAGLLAMVFD